MRTANYDFRWFEKEDGRKRLRASVGQDGKLRLGEGLREKLPPLIRVGFDSEAMVLAIAESQEADVSCVRRPRNGVILARMLSAQITATGLRPPVAFDLSRDQKAGYFVGKIVIQPRKNASGRAQINMEQLLILCRPMLKRVLSQAAKSIPLEERRSIAMEALCAAAGEYGPDCGDLEQYLEKRVRMALKEGNKPYVKDFGCVSLDRPLDCGDGDDRCLYDMIADGDDWATVDDRIDIERFCQGLPSKQRGFLQMLQVGFSIPEIAEIMGTNKGTLHQMEVEIARQKRAFDGEGENGHTNNRKASA